MLRARGRRVQPSSRVAACGRRVVGEHGAYATLEVTDGRAQWVGVLTCGHIWDCPRCSWALRAQRAEQIEAAVKGLGGTWAMLTLTVRHQRDMVASDVVRTVRLALRKLRKIGTVARLWTRSVRASVRALELTIGPNGVHPHIHILLALRESEVPSDLAAAVAEHWPRVVASIEPRCKPLEKTGVVWSRPRDASVDACAGAAYAAKMGFEATGAGKWGERSMWRLLERAAQGDARAAAQWEAYVRATKGARAVELDDRAARAAKHHLMLQAMKNAPEPREQTTSTKFERTPVDASQLYALSRLERRWPDVFDLVLRDAEKMGGPAALDLWLQRARAP